MSLPRAVGRFIIVGSQVMSKAFVQAYKQMIANAAQQSTGQAAASKSSTAVRRGEMTIQEAGSILNIKPESLEAGELEKRFQKMFEINDPKKGGSFYLQSKVFRAHEKLKSELDQKIREQSPAKPTSSP
ncbi:Mitochondrial import inner membrane translocase subunit tim16 [Schizosaccharomyces pombe]